jgi:predicted ATPase/DNA-binding XRE family transcriptional regulator
MAEVSFGEWLKRQRGALGLTQAQLAQKIGCSTIALRKIEAEDRRASESIVERLAEIFDVPVNERAAFLRFARGDWAATPSDTLGEAPWRASPPAIHPRSNLPAAVTSLIGRKQEIALVRDYLKKDTRLVTLIGPPGIGKTRLGLEVAQEVSPDFAAGVFFIALASLDDPVLLAPTLVRTLGLVETKNRSPLEQIIDGIEDKPLLLVLDNVEHLVEGTAPLVSNLLTACPRLKLIVTSRESLRVPGEWLYPVPPLTIPDEAQLKQLSPAAALDFSALTLFTERARAAWPDFALTSENAQTVAAICRQLDGLPLAIELIAARIRLLSPQALLSRLTSDFTLHVDGMRALPARHKTLQNAIAWSYDLLSRDEQTLLARLAVFAGGFGLAAAEATTQPHNVIQGLTSLLNKSLLVRTSDEDGEARFNLLGIIHDFALDRLRERNEETMMRDRHAAYFFELARQAVAHWLGPEEARWLDQLERESLNLHAALTWSFARGALKETLLAVYHLGGFWVQRGRRAEGSQWCARLLAAYPEADDLKLRGLVLGLVLARLRYDFAQMQAYLNEARPLAETTGNQLKTIVLREEALYARAQGREAEAVAALERAVQLYRQEQLPDISEALYWLAEIWMMRGEFEKSRPLWEEGLAHARQFESAFYTGWGLGGLAHQARLEGQLEKAIELGRESLAIKWQHQDQVGVAFSLAEQALIAAQQGNLDRAVRLWSVAQHYRDINYAPLSATWQAEEDLHLAQVSAQLGPDRFAALQAEGSALTLEQAVELAL